MKTEMQTGDYVYATDAGETIPAVVIKITKKTAIIDDGYRLYRRAIKNLVFQNEEE